MVTDAKKKTALASVSIKVLPISLSIDGLPQSAMFGEQAQIKAVAGAMPADQNPVYFWTVNVPLKIGKASSSSPKNTLGMSVIGPATIRVQLNLGNTIVGSSPDYKVDVTPPQATLSASPTNPKVGDTVTVSAAIPEGVDAKMVQWQWMQPKEGKAAGSTLTFKLNNEAPVTVLVVLKNARDGQTLSQATLDVSAGESIGKESEGANAKVESSSTPSSVAIATQISDGKFRDALDSLDKLKKTSSADAANLQQQWLSAIGASIDSDTENVEFNRAEKNLELGNQVSPTGVRFSIRSQRLEQARGQWEHLQILDDKMDSEIKITNMPGADELTKSLVTFRNTTLLRGNKPMVIYDSISKRYNNELKRYRNMLDVTYRDEITTWNSHGDYEKTVDRSNSLLELGLYPIDRTFVTDQRDKASLRLKQQQAKTSAAAKAKSDADATAKATAAATAKATAKAKATAAAKAKSESDANAIAAAVNAEPNTNKASSAITIGKTTAGSTYSGQTRGDVFNGGSWCSASNGSEYLQREFGEVREVTGLYIKRAGTDVSTKGSRIVIKLLGQNGDWVTVDDLKETNINWVDLSFGGKGRSIPPYQKSLSPIRAKAFRLELTGNGWFGAEDIRILGAVSGHSSEPVIAPKAKPKPSQPTSSYVKLSVAFYNGDNRPLHMFMKGQSFGPGNKTLPGSMRSEDYRVMSGSKVVFCAGRDGIVLYTGNYTVPSGGNGIRVAYTQSRGIYCEKK
ncbi:MAG: hypothetical protein WCL39_06135 [Armatimonadota bacterium]